MRIPLTVSLVTMMMLSLASAAVAGTPDAPELVDAAGDATGCYGGLANEYADVVAAWISDETATAFNVNIALEKWTADALGTATGYTLQFEHQGVQFGAIGAYIPAPLGPGWDFSNGFVDTETGELSNFQQAEGSFTPGSPALISVVFQKGHFPHSDSTDNRLVNFKGGSADFKNTAADSLDPTGTVPEQSFFICDTAESSATYTFTVGDHSTHDMGGAGNMSMDDSGAGMAPANDSSTDGSMGSTAGRTAASTDDGAKDTPAPGFLVVVGVAVAVAFVRRVRA